ncbi:MAG: Gfo/Idh/MocA family protein [bacterium]|jgi:predicted dehydrogenase
MTWLMKEQHPTSVTAITQSFKPKIYPKVDDEATIIVTYPNAVGIIEASWNWTYNRKDMDIYGTEGALLADNSSTLRMKSTRGEEEQVELEPLHAPQNNPLSYLKAVVRGEIEPEGLSSLNNNMIVTSILSAARESAASGKTIYFRD